MPGNEKKNYPTKDIKEVPRKKLKEMRRNSDEKEIRTTLRL